MAKWNKRIAKGIVALLLVALLIGLGYEQVSRWRASRSFPPPGALYEVDGQMAHLHCSGEGEPTVILEAGLDVFGSLSWSNIYPDLAESNRVCAYDRAGIMWSRARDDQRDAVSIADELHAMLTVASERPPYVMVGHSLGGQLVRVFDQRFPGEVEGFVFVDSSHPEQVELSPAEVTGATPSPLRFKVLGAIGLLRLSSSSGGPEALPDKAAAAVVGFRPGSVLGMMREAAALDAIDEQSGETGNLGDRPLVVLTAGAPDPRPDWTQETSDRMEEVWQELQVELAALSTNVDHRVVPEASHYVHWDAPHAVLVAVGDVVKAVRSGAPVRADGGGG